jgi:hypothetical protein
MSKEYGEYEVPGQGPTKRDIRQTLNGVRRLAGNNPIADVLEFRKEYTVVDVSQRDRSTAAAETEPVARHGETQRPGHGPRPAWSRGADVNTRLRYGRQSGEIEAGAWPERPSARHPRDEAHNPTPSMKETIRAARAFFGPGMADAVDPDDDEPAVAAESPRDGEVLPDTTAHADAEGETAPHAVAADPQPVEPVAVPPVTPDDPAVARVHRLSTLSMLDVATEEPPAIAENEASDEESAETLLAEIACEIVEDALVVREEPELAGEPDVQHAAAPEEPDELAVEQARLLLDEDRPTDEDADNDSMLLFDDMENTVTEVSAEAAPEEAAAMPAAHAVEPVGKEDEDKASSTVSLRRDRHPGPRLPIDGFAQASAATGTGPRTARGRAVGSPKWSASARHHMSDMLATSDREPAPTIRGRSGVELPRIDLSPDRHRQSSAMILLGLPVMLLVGFGGAYVYHASTYDPARVFDEARNAIPASIASIPGIGTAKPTRKISESIIQKQEEAVATPARAEPLPPPVAPPLGDPTTSRATPAAPQATRTAKVDTQPVAKTPDRVPDSARIEPAAAPVTSALMVAPAEQARAEPELPKPVAPEPLAPEPANKTTVAALPVPAAEQAAPELARPADSAGSEPATEATRMAALVPDALPLPEEAGETGQLIARGNERMEIGDIAAARLLFELAAESGSPVAATAMGRSYDPVYFVRVGVRGVKPDAAKAKDWYEKAVSGGDRTAEQDLNNLTAWLTRQ